MKKREREGRSSALSLLDHSEILQQKKKFEKIDPKKRSSPSGRGIVSFPERLRGSR
jgi:hypothetical protein